MKVITSGKLAVFFLFALLCGSATLAAAAGTCPHCNCPTGNCICPACLDSNYYPGFCAGIGCQDGFACCRLENCGDCACIECNPAYCLASGYGCDPDGCPFVPGVVENIEANNRLQPWMVDETLPTQLSTYSKTWSAVVAALQRDFSDTMIPLGQRRKLLLSNIDHVELGLPEYKQGVVIESRYKAQNGAWILRLVRGLNGDQSRADILVITPHKWTLHNEASGEHIGDGKIAPMPNVLDFPTDQNVETQFSAALAKAKAASAIAGALANRR